MILDGPLGTELLARGVPTPLPGWSAHALETAPEVVAAIHRDYALAGAELHTANTFRTKRRVFPDRWRALVRRAIELARSALPPAARLAGSIAPLEDCYRPDLSPATADPEGARAEHAELARELAAGGCDLLLCETFPHEREGLLAVEAALETGLEVWASFTPGYRADLLTPAELAAAGARAAALGARAVLVNCVPTREARRYVAELRAAVTDERVAVGCYANAGQAEERMGWRAEPGAPERYAELALEWRRAGALHLGGCCGTGPAHVAALAARFGPPAPPAARG